MDAVRTSSVLVHHRAHVEAGRDDVDGSSWPSTFISTTRPFSAGRPSSHHAVPRSSQTAFNRVPARAIISASMGDDQVPNGAAVCWRFERANGRRLWYSAVRPTRDQAWETLTRYTKSEALLRHALAVEASVRHYARLRGEDEEFWGCTALLHDFDYEIHPTLDKHPQDGAQILRDEGYPEELIEGVLSHAEHLAMPRDTLAEEDVVRV